MMDRLFLTAVLVCSLTSCSTLSQKQIKNTLQTSTQATTLERPKLVVGIVVDQMRYDYLTKFYSRFKDGGFKRLMNDGFNATNNHFNFAPTYTAPGHASVYTGTSPMNNGIIGNDWYDKFEKKSVYNAGDDAYEPVGTTAAEGKMSPRKLLTTTITDELELHTQGRSKVIGISIKDRGAIIPAGHAADAAYWFYGKDEGAFISSTFYMNTLPQWVQDFNTSGTALSYFREWDTMYPIETYTASGTDLNDYEKPPRGKETATFPYNLATLNPQNRGYDLIKATPYGNSIVADFALAALKNEQLGTHADPDFLAISFSSTDYIGHQYGVNSVEIEDTYLRLDNDLERLLNAFDMQVGKGNYTVFLTADHGAVDNPAYLQSRKINAGYFDERSFKKELNEAVNAQFKVDGIIENISNDQIFFDHEVTKKANLNENDIQDFIAGHSITDSHIAYVYTRHALMNTSFVNGTGRLVQNGFNMRLSGDVVYVLAPGFIDYSMTGSTHGSPQSYDTHVPLLMFGFGIKKGTTAARVEVVDIAPTIATILKIAFPNGCTGNPIQAALQN